MITEILNLIIFGLLFVYLFVVERRPWNYPPGPSWWPFIGNSLLLRKLSKELKGQHLALSKLAKDYNTPILGLKLGGQLVIVGQNAEAVRAILTRDVFTGRPNSFFMNLRCFGKRQGITSTDGEEWKTQRTFTVQYLKYFGYGKEKMEFLIMDEVNDVIDLLKQDGKVESIGEMTAPCVLNVLWALVTGKRLEKADPKLKKLLKLLNRRSRTFDMAGGILNQMPWLRFVAPKQTGYSLLQELNSELRSFLMEIIQEQKDSYSPDEIRNIVDAFMEEGNSNKNGCNFSDDGLVVLLLDLFLGGAQTTSQTLDFAFLLMIRYPEIQEKVYQTIVEKIGKDRLPTLKDKEKLAYIEAVLLEVMRVFCVVPIIGPRRSLKDTQLNGYDIPEDTTILLNLHSVHFDENLFPEPERFRPERFLDSEGKLTDQKNVLTFGLGKRRCLGDNLANSFLFLIFSGILQNFEITKGSEEEPSMEPLLGLTLAPRPYSAMFRSRTST